jgi:hypothetical protein
MLTPTGNAIMISLTSRGKSGAGDDDNALGGAGKRTGTKSSKTSFPTVSVEGWLRGVQNLFLQ